MAAFDFNPNDLHRLARLQLSLRRLPLQARSGGHHARHSGDSLEFLDFRPYMPGDDFRQIDWAMYGRHRQLFIRRREMPRELGVNLLIDTSRSMTFGGSQSKMLLAQRMACGLAFIALRGGDRVTVASFADSLYLAVGPLSGLKGFDAVLQSMASLRVGEQSLLKAALHQLRTMRRHRGLTIICSDFLNVTDLDQAIRAVESGGGRVMLVQVLDDLDRGIGLPAGMVRLRDSESGAMVDVRISESVVESYQAEFERSRQQLEDHCRRHNRPYIMALTADDYLHLICDVMRNKAVLR